MASILSGSFVDNLRRIYSSAHTSQRSERGELARLDPENKAFLTALNEVQTPPADARPSLAPPMLTNMSPEEMQGGFRLSPQLTLTNVRELPASVKTVTLPFTPTVSPTVPLEPKMAVVPPIPPLPIPENTKPAVPRLLEGVREEVAIHPLHGKSEIASVITAAGQHHGVDTNLSLAVAKAESNFNPVAVSSDGYASKGIFQLLDSTGREMMNRTQVNAPYDPFDPGLNAHLGVGYLKRLHTLFGKESNLGYNLRTIPANTPESLEKLAVAAFNAGEGRVAQAQHRARLHGLDPREYASVERFLPKTTRAYVERVSLYRMQFAQAERASEVA